MGAAANKRATGCRTRLTTKAFQLTNPVKVERSHDTWKHSARSVFYCPISALSLPNQKNSHTLLDNPNFNPTFNLAFPIVLNRFRFFIPILLILLFPIRLNRFQLFQFIPFSVRPPPYLQLHSAQSASLAVDFAFLQLFSRPPDIRLQQPVKAQPAWILISRLQCFNHRLHLCIGIVCKIQGQRLQKGRLFGRAVLQLAVMGQNAVL